MAATTQAILLIFCFGSFLLTTGQDTSAVFKPDIKQDTSWSSSPRQPVQPTKFQLPAMGRTAQLGELYDAVSETFLGYSAFTDRLPPTSIRKTHVPWTSSKYVLSNVDFTFGLLLGIDLELTISILFGLIKISGSAGYIMDMEKSVSIVAAYMDYQVRTEKWSISPFHQELQGFIAKNLLENSPATHMVIGIEHGGDVVVKLKQGFISSNITDETRGTFGFVLKAVASVFKQVLGKVLAVGDGAIGSDASFEIFGDVLPPSSQPKSLAKIREFVQNVPKLIKKYNGGIGKPMMYTLLPLEVLRKKLNVTSGPKVPKLIVPIGEETLEELFYVSKLQSKASGKIKELLDQIKPYEKCVQTEHLEKLQELDDLFGDNVKNFRDTVKKMMIQVRSGKMDPANLDDFIQEYLDGPSSPNRIQEQLKSPEFTKMLDKIGLCKTLLEAGSKKNGEVTEVDYLTRAHDLWNLKEKSRTTSVYILFYSVEMTERDENAWRDISGYFFKLAGVPGNKMAVVDCEFPAAECQALGIEKITLQHYKNGMMAGELGKILENTKVGSYPIIKIPALGTKHKIGTLYDAKRGTFLEDTITQSDIKNVLQAPASDFHSKVVFPKQHLSEKLRALRIPIKLRLGMIFPENSESDTLAADSLLKEYLEDSEVNSAGLVNIMKTVREVIDQRDLDFIHKVNLENSREKRATHFLQAIDFGATTIFQLPIEEKSNLEDIKTNLVNIRTLFKSILLQGDQKAPSKNNETKSDADKGQLVGPSFNLTNLNSKSTIKVFSDLLPYTQELEPDDPEQIVEVILNIRDEIGRSQNGTGTPVGYILYPLSQLDHLAGFGPSSRQHVGPKSSGPKILEDHWRLIEQLEEVQQAEDSLILFSSRFKFFLEKHEASLSCDIEELIELEASFKESFQEKKEEWISKLRSVLEEPIDNQNSDIFKSLRDEVKNKLSPSLVLKNLNSVLGVKMESCEMDLANKPEKPVEFSSSSSETVLNCLSGTVNNLATRLSAEVSCKLEMTRQFLSHSCGLNQTSINDLIIPVELPNFCKDE